MLETYIKKQYNENVLQDKYAILSLINGEHRDEAIEKISPIIEDNYKLININVEDRLEEYVLLLKEYYYDTEKEVFEYDKNIIILGVFREIEKETLKIKELLSKKTSVTNYICYSNIKDCEDFKKAYLYTKNKIQAAKSNHYDKEIIKEEDLLLELMMNSLTDEIEDNIPQKVMFNISKLDDEIMRTIDALFKCNLNLSESAKMLFIHRNTLVYRLDKIEKLTSYNLRQFNSAMLFKIVFYHLQRKNKINS